MIKITWLTPSKHWKKQNHFKARGLPNFWSNTTSFYMGVSKNRGTHKSWVLIAFSIINHPFREKTPYCWKHPYTCSTSFQQFPSHHFSHDAVFFFSHSTSLLEAFRVHICCKDLISRCWLVGCKASYWALKPTERHLHHPPFFGQRKQQGPARAPRDTRF